MQNTLLHAGAYKIKERPSFVSCSQTSYSDNDLLDGAEAIFSYNSWILLVSLLLPIAKYLLLPKLQLLYFLDIAKIMKRSAKIHKRHIKNNCIPPLPPPQIKASKHDNCYDCKHFKIFKVSDHGILNILFSQVAK